jgi:hypothetical protein
LESVIEMQREYHLEPGPQVAGIRHDGTLDIDAFLARIVAGERARGRRLRGVLMTYPEGRDGCNCALELLDIETAETYRVSQDLGQGSEACRADAGAFARASMVLRRALAVPAGEVDLVITNRFGALEAEGGGFAAELLALLSAGIPVLTVVSTRHRAAWERFTGEASLLPPDEGAVRAWIDEALAARSASA